MAKDNHSSNNHSRFKLLGNKTLSELTNHLIKTIDTVAKQLDALDTDEIKSNLVNLLSPQENSKTPLRTENGNVFSYKGHESTLTLPDGVCTIKRGAFLDNKTLEYIALPASLVTIEADAFKGCTRLKKVAFGSNSQLHTIQSRAFMGCTALQSISFGSKLSNIQSDAFKGCTSLREVYFDWSSRLENLTSDVFAKCTALTTITWPHGIRLVAQSAIQDCPLSTESLAELERYLQFSPKRHAYVKPAVIRSDAYTRPKTNTVSADTSSNSAKSQRTNTQFDLEEALEEAKQLATLESKIRSTYHVEGDRPVLDETLRKMQRKAWQYEDDAPSETKSHESQPPKSKPLEPQIIHTAAGLYLEGDELVGVDPGLTQLIIPAEIHNIGPTVANQSPDIEAIEVLGEIKKIHDHAFSGLTSLKSVHFHENVNHIAERAFENCTKLESVQFDKSLYILGKYSFTHCTALEKIHIPDDCGQINEGAFQNCRALKHVHLPKQLGRIPANLFCGCYQLESIDWPDTREINKDIIIDDTAFHNTLSDLSCEQFILHDGVLKREAVDISKIDPDRIFDLRPENSRDYIMNIPQYIINSALNSAWECSLNPVRCEFQIKLLKTCLTLADLITSTPQHDNRAEKLYAILRLKNLQNDLASTCHHSLEDALPYAIAETLYAIGGNGSMRFNNVKEIEKIVKKYYDALSNPEENNDQRIYQANEIYSEVFVRQMSLYSIMKSLSIDDDKPNLYNPHAWKYTYPFVAEDTYTPCSAEYYDFINGMKSIIENQFGYLMSTGSDLSNEPPETWFKTLGQATAESTEDHLHLVIFKTDEYISECETHLKDSPMNTKKHYKYATFLAPDTIQRIQFMLKEFDLQDIFIDYAPSLKLVP